MVKKIITEYEPDKCKCDWTGWISIYDWPEDRKNKQIPFSEPIKNGKYLVRIQDHSADRYESESIYTIEPRTIRCGYTGKEIIVHWEGYDEDQPYAWKEIDGR